MIEYQKPNAGGDTDVGIQHWSDVSEPDVIGTTGLSACIGVAVLNDTIARAWVLHSPNMVHAGNGLRTMLGGAAEESAPEHVVRIILTGGTDDDPGVQAEIEKDRTFTRAAVAEFFPRTEPVVVWGEIEDFFVEYRDGAWRDTDGCPHFDP